MSRYGGIPLSASPAEFAAFEERVEAAAFARWERKNTEPDWWDEDAEELSALETERLDFEAGERNPE